MATSRPALCDRSTRRSALLLVALVFTAACEGRIEDEPTAARATGEQVFDPGALVGSPDASALPKTDAAPTGFNFDAATSTAGDARVEDLDGGFDAGLDAGQGTALDGGLGTDGGAVDAAIGACAQALPGNDTCSACAKSACCSELLACKWTQTCTFELGQTVGCTEYQPVSTCLSRYMASTEAMSVSACVRARCAVQCP